MEYARGTVLDNYKLLARVGTGSCGIVWQAENIVSGELEALKILSSSGDLAERELRALKLYREINHPALIRIRHIGRAGETFFYTMDWCESSLAERRVSAKELPEIAKVLTEGLAALHARGLLHRDIKPANIFFRQGAPVLGDIGLLTRQEGATLAGTPGFLAPQLLSGKGSADCYSDCYALAKSLYCALTGLGPEQFPLYTGDMTPEASLLIRGVIAVCSEPPAIRTADEFLHFLKDSASLKRKRRVWPWLLLPLLAALCAAVFFLMRPQKKTPPAPGPEIEKQQVKQTMPEKQREERTTPEKQPEAELPPQTGPTTPVPSSAPVPSPASPRPAAPTQEKPDREAARPKVPPRDPTREEIEKKFTALPPEEEAKLRRLEHTAEVFRLLGSSGRLRITEEEEQDILSRLTPEQGKIWQTCCMKLRRMQSSAKWKKAEKQWRSQELGFKSQLWELTKKRKQDALDALRLLCEKEPLLAFWICQAKCLDTQEKLFRAAGEKTPSGLSDLLNTFSAQTEECCRRFATLSR